MGASSSRHLRHASFIDGGVYEILPKGQPDYCFALDNHHREVQLTRRAHGHCPQQRFVLRQRDYHHQTFWVVESQVEPGLVLKIEPTSLTEKSYRLCMRTFYHDDATTDLERESALFTVEYDAKQYNSTNKKQLPKTATLADGSSNNETALIRCCAEPSCFIALATDVNAAIDGTMPNVVVATLDHKIKKFDDVPLTMQFEFAHVPLVHEAAYELVPRHALQLRAEAVITSDHSTVQLARHTNSRSQRFVARQRPDFSWALSPCTNGLDDGDVIVTNLAVCESNDPFNDDHLENPVSLEPINDSDPRQGFVVRVLGRGFAELVNLHSGRVLDCFKAGSVPGTHVYTATRHGTEGHMHQQFELRAATQTLATTPAASVPVSPATNREDRRDTATTSPKPYHLSHDAAEKQLNGSSSSSAASDSKGQFQTQYAARRFTISG